MSPKIFVAVDVGMTCTGVCYAVADQTSQFYMIQRWPGSSGASADKASCPSAAARSVRVPTVVCYRNGRFSSWGFETRQEDVSDPELDIGEWFKIYLDRKEYRNAPENSWPRSYEDIKRAYRDFLRQLYLRIKEELESAVIRGSAWQDADIEFIFSVPTTWTAMSITSTFEALIHEAGFESGGTNHKAVIGLTEAEAAAIHTFATEKQMYQDGQIILVVDAGGGTTDLALLKAEKKPGQKYSLKELDNVRGLELGSVEIDLAFEDLVLDRLQDCASELGLSLQDCEKASRKMAREDFRPHKENFGSDMSDRQNTKNIAIPGVPSSVNIPHAGVRGGGLLITNDDIKAIFDRQLNRMTQLIDLQMDKMTQVAPYSQIASLDPSYMVLSGGLGSSEYVRKRLIERYITNRSTSHHHANGVSIVRSRHPQAAPVQGLLHERISRSAPDSDSMLRERISRFSLGIICDQQYDPIAHLNAELYFDTTDGKRYARSQIAWFIRKGDPITQSPISHSFYRTQKKYEVRVPWESQIVLSHNSGSLPRSLREDGVVKLCRMTSDLTRVDLSQFQKHKKPWYSCDSSKQTYFTAQYEIKFIPGAAARIDAELWFKNQRYNEPSSFGIEFDEGASVPAPGEVTRAVDTNYDRVRTFARY